MQLLSKRFTEDDESESFALMAEQAKISFAQQFWDSKQKYLNDVVCENLQDNSLRPNQIIVLGLDFEILDTPKNENIFNVVRDELLTPFGLKTLSNKDPKYVGIYFGDREKRDLAYHNGTVWPWLLGFFIKAFVKIKFNLKSERMYALNNFLKPLFDAQPKAGLGFLSEIFDGDLPHLPRGCIAQAWSIAEPLRAYIEDILQLRPKYEKSLFTSSM
jgi:glycogen debranching enzyme